MKRAIFLFLLGFGASIAFAQQETPELEESEGLLFRTWLFAAGTQQSAESADQQEIAPELPDLFYYDEGEYRPVDCSLSGVSEPYRFLGGSALRFFVRTLGSGGEWIYEEVLNAEVGRSWTNALIVLLPEYNRRGGLKVFAVNTTPEDFEPGSIRVYNLSPREVVLNANKEIYPLYPMDPVAIDISGIEKNLLPVALALKEDEEFQLVYRRRWSLRPNIRGVYFLFTLNGDLRRWYMRNIIL